ncbi:CpsD/CapB family tyrosine-protein kinase [Paenibacillus urinalis]|uniref:non-specific protein-tyrosine kinase n=1 Tax=Paenibacillus urinalis TaxID=521520 RepID=A0AAX3N3S6_9BACL|nr:CpsD/CapB family tyrosine-protein kinase [Paenibacillus urinalis]WDH83784.1 CpsD/CapB family tyrosine-protein kinase [Paenibacillus urinalis]WDH99809.1 CpsD/CapB family tyrosine-protein kinase [Paenibacillus urinalis]WDI03439.1 CpsD/CapB family tyrosine-protein kinase [Paenibacillus urinalis]
MPRSTSNQHNLVTAVNPKAPISEAYRTLRTNIQFSAIDDQIKVLMVASAQSGEGKTTTVSNLAVTYAQEGKKVLLIDTDLRKPSLHQVFTVSNHAGLSSAIAAQYPVQEVLQKTAVHNLDVLPSGPIPPNPSEMLGSKKMTALLEELKEMYDIILFDTPPVLAVTDAMIISSLCDGVVLVVNSGKVKKDLVKKAKGHLEHVNARILGVVLNNLQLSKNQSNYYYYYGER